MPLIPEGEQHTEVPLTQDILQRVADIAEFTLKDPVKCNDGASLRRALLRIRALSDPSFSLEDARSDVKNFLASAARCIEAGHLHTARHDFELARGAAAGHLELEQIVASFEQSFF